MTQEEAQQWIDAQQWINAKSYSATFPHVYITRSKCTHVDLFEPFLHYLREHSKLKTFFKKQYLYLEMNGFELWEMGRPIPSIEVINKAPIDDNASYRSPQVNLDDEAILKKKLADREKFLSDLMAKNTHSDIEKRQIAFLLNNERRIHGGGKNIIDHSSIGVRYE
jgi:hypothetical protein